LHSQNIVHRDIKPENIIFDKKGYLRITDFGISRKIQNRQLNDLSGTPSYMAPEILMRRGHSFSVDTYALGVIMCEFMTGKRPYLGRSRKEVKIF
jgi:serine/threonine protein kinase